MTFNKRALATTLASLLVFALAARVTDAGASPIGAILIAGIVVAVGYGFILAGRSLGFFKMIGLVVGVLVALTILRLLWKLALFAWR